MKCSPSIGALPGPKSTAQADAVRGATRAGYLSKGELNPIHPPANPFYFAQQWVESMKSPTFIGPCAAAQYCEHLQRYVAGKVLTGASGAVLQDRSCEDCLDHRIRSLGDAAVQSDKDGDPHGARIYTARMYQAIRSRTPEHQARLLREVERSINEGDFQGKWTERLCAEIRSSHYDVPGTSVRRRMRG